MKSNYLIAGLLALLVLVSFSFAAEVNVGGTVQNDPPTFSAIYVNTNLGPNCLIGNFDNASTGLVTINPSFDSVCVRLVGVNDPNGELDISLGNSYVIAWSGAGNDAAAEAGHGWDHHPFTFVDCEDPTSTITELSLGQTEICAYIPPNTDLTSSNGIGGKDISGATWNIRAEVEDKGNNTAISTFASSITVNTIIGLSVAPISCNFLGSPGDKLPLDCSGTPTERVVMTHEGNVNQDTEIIMSGSLTSTGDSIDGTSLFWGASQLSLPLTLSAPNNLSVPRFPVTVWQRGTTDPDILGTQNTFLYIELPAILESGAYSNGVITYSVTAT